WLPRVERREARLPMASAHCPPPALSAVAQLSIVGVREGDRLRRPAAAQASVRLALSALGGDGRRWWFLNGRPLGDTGFEQTLTISLEQAGRYELSVLDESGQTARVEFSVEE
ncbi:penicillin-binding protein 1C, partial [Pseudomonas helleri]|nr:penicillin-binding protein 1C [Pseudomonas helleri]